MRKTFRIAAGLLASLVPGTAMAQHHGGRHSTGHGSYGGHGRVVVSNHGYGYAQPYYGGGYYADSPRYQSRHYVRDRHYDRHSRPRHYRRHP